MKTTNWRTISVVSLAAATLAVMASAGPVDASVIEPLPAALVPENVTPSASQPISREAIASASLVAVHEGAEAAGLASGLPTVPDAETLCLAKVVLRESGGQPLDGQIAVAQVVINRTQSARFPSTICGVAEQPGQFFNVDAFDFTGDRRWSTALRVAEEVRAGAHDPVVGDALYFHSAKARSGYCPHRVSQLGGQVFCAA